MAKKLTFKGFMEKKIPAGMATILYNKGKTVIMVPKGKIKGITFNKKDLEDVGMDFPSIIEWGKREYGEVGFRYKVAL